MRIIAEPISGLLVLEPKVYKDDRGFFMETWKKEVFTELGIKEEFVQDNHSKSNEGTLRGLHYQVNKVQGKLVRVTQGEVFDVAVDLRMNSSTYGKWHGEILSERNKSLMWIPPGFAHGFYVLSETAEFQYKCSNYYSSVDERCIKWDDADLNIQWPIPPSTSPIISDKDAKGHAFSSVQKVRVES